MYVFICMKLLESAFCFIYSVCMYVYCMYEFFSFSFKRLQNFAGHRECHPQRKVCLIISLITGCHGQQPLSVSGPTPSVALNIHPCWLPASVYPFHGCQSWLLALGKSRGGWDGLQNVWLVKAWSVGVDLARWRGWIYHGTILCVGE